MWTLFIIHDTENYLCQLICWHVPTSFFKPGSAQVVGVLKSIFHNETRGMGQTVLSKYIPIFKISTDFLVHFTKHHELKYHIITFLKDMCIENSEPPSIHTWPLLSISSFISALSYHRHAVCVYMYQSVFRVQDFISALHFQSTVIFTQN